MRKPLALAICLFVFTSIAMAQHKLETKWHCDKPAAQQKLDIGDAPDHSYVLAQGNCTVTSGNTGEKSGTYTETQEVWKTSFKNRGRLNVTLDNGDKAYYTYEGSGHPAKKTASNHWNIVSGTGKHKGMTATGSCNGVLADDGSSDWTCSGSSATPK